MTPLWDPASKEAEDRAAAIEAEFRRHATDPTEISRRISETIARHRAAAQGPGDDPSCAPEVPCFPSSDPTYEPLPSALVEALRWSCSLDTPTRSTAPTPTRKPVRDSTRSNWLHRLWRTVKRRRR